MLIENYFCVNLHMFSDASESTCVSLLLTNMASETRVTLLAKSRIATSKKITLSRLELSAVVLGVAKLKPILRTKIDREIYECDSKITLR